MCQVSSKDHAYQVWALDIENWQFQGSDRSTSRTGTGTRGKEETQMRTGFRLSFQPAVPRFWATNLGTANPIDLTKSQQKPTDPTKKPTKANKKPTKANKSQQKPTEANKSQQIQSKNQRSPKPANPAQSKPCRSDLKSIKDRKSLQIGFFSKKWWKSSHEIEDSTLE